MSDCLIKVKYSFLKGFMSKDDFNEEEGYYLKIKVYDTGPVMTREEEIIILKPLASLR
jgi:hypothetical protein